MYKSPKLLPIALSLALALGIIPLPAFAASGVSLHKASLTAQSVGTYGADLASAAYQSNINPFYAAGYGGNATNGYGGECTWYAWGRAYEKLGVSLPCRGNENSWTSEAAGSFETGTTARANSIMVEHYAGTGHVFFVEDVANGYAYVSEGNWLGVYHEDTINLTTNRRTSDPNTQMGSRFCRHAITPDCANSQVVNRFASCGDIPLLSGC
ncbi:MAG: CHAP domain-containing protein [Eggerthellaceae bacterium]|nr:CHAP domain-containing protein [Eggerthellaceae bacterium]